MDENDLHYENHGSIITMTPLTDAGREWCREHLPEDALALGESICNRAPLLRRDCLWRTRGRTHFERPSRAVMKKQLGRGAWVGFTVNPDGYSVTVYDPESREVETYDAGNHRGDSQVWLCPDDPDALDAETLKRFARQTAEEMAGEYGINLPMVQEEES
jgi:predicted RNA-binding protein YlxR (DUF448 family)